MSCYAADAAARPFEFTSEHSTLAHKTYGDMWKAPTCILHLRSTVRLNNGYRYLLVLALALYLRRRIRLGDTTDPVCRFEKGYPPSARTSVTKLNMPKLEHCSLTDIMLLAELASAAKQVTLVSTDIRICPWLQLLECLIDAHPAVTYS